MSTAYPESEISRGMFKKRGGSKNASQNNWNTTECAETELCLTHQSCVVGRVERTDALEDISINDGGDDDDKWSMISVVRSIGLPLIESQKRILFSCEREEGESGR